MPPFPLHTTLLENTHASKRTSMDVSIHFDLGHLLDLKCFSIAGTAGGPESTRNADCCGMFFVSGFDIAVIELFLNKNLLNILPTMLEP